MNVAELRDILKEYKEEELRALVVEMYKAIPKKIKEYNEIDEIIKDFKQYKEKERTKKETKIDFEMLKQEIEQFITYAYKQYYLAPNSIVRKKERPKWRFIVKRFFKELQIVQPAGKAEAEEIVELLKKLYEMLCYASGHYLFSKIHVG